MNKETIKRALYLRNLLEGKKWKNGQLVTIDNVVYRVTKCSASFSCLQCDFYMCNGSRYPYQPYCLICPILLPFGCMLRLVKPKKHNYHDR